MFSNFKPIQLKKRKFVETNWVQLLENDELKYMSRLNCFSNDSSDRFIAKRKKFNWRGYIVVS